MVNSDQIAVRLTKVKKTFGKGAANVAALREINLDAHCGEILLLVGPSGCGKTTLLSVITGLLDADSGSIDVFGQSVDQMNAEQKTAFRRNNVGFVFQQFNLIPTLTAAQNASIPLLISGIAQKEAFAQAQKLLAQVGMEKRKDAYPADLSGGEQQRVAIARALIGNPRLLVCDEPTAALDGDTGSKVMSILRETSLKNDRCVIVVTHDARIFPFGDRIAEMLDGQITSVRENNMSLAA